MKIYLFSFTDTGAAVCERLARRFDECIICEKPVTEAFIAEAFCKSNALVFVGALGIAVRKIAPHIVSKQTDPAVIVIDELGQHVIPVLSGHIGGANGLAHKLAAFLGARAIITTATDLHGKFAVDTWAVRSGLAIMNAEAVKHVSGAVLRDETVGVISDFPMENEPPPGVASGAAKTGICISLDGAVRTFENTLWLAPKCIVIGMGCRRDAPQGDCEALLDEMLAGLGIPREAISAVATIDIKKDEAALLGLCESLGCGFYTYSAAELRAVRGDFAESRFVLEKTGVGNVCERAAAVASGGGRILCRKTAKNGVTIAVAQADFIVRWQHAGL